MNYESVYTTLKAKLTALAKNAAVRLPNEPPAENTALDIRVSVTETDCHPYTEIESNHYVSMDILTSVPGSEGTERIHHIASQLVTAFDPLQGGDFWTDDNKYFVGIQSVSQKQLNMANHRYQINVRILTIIQT